MATIAEQLTQLASIKSDIKDAIEAKGETVGDDAFSTYATHIGNISSGGGGGVAGTTFYDCSSTPPGAKGSGGGSGPQPPGPQPGTHITFYVQYPNNNNKVPDMFIFNDKNKRMTNNTVNYGIITQTQSLVDVNYGGTGGMNIAIINITATLVTLQYDDGFDASFDTTKFQFAPIYLS